MKLKQLQCIDSNPDSHPPPQQSPKMPRGTILTEFEKGKNDTFPATRVSISAIAAALGCSKGAIFRTTWALSASSNQKSNQKSTTKFQSPITSVSSAPPRKGITARESLGIRWNYPLLSDAGSSFCPNQKTWGINAWKRHCMEHNNVTILPWPARSPGLNIIENLW